MADEFDSLTESDKLRSFQETRALSERLAESNAKIFDAEMKGLNLDDARKESADKDLERQDKLNQRRYNIEFSKGIFKTKDSKGREDFVNEFMANNPDAGPFMPSIVSNYAKSVSGLRTLQGQEMEIEKQRELQELQIGAEQSRLRYETISSDYNAKEIRIKDAISENNAIKIVDELNGSMPETYSTIFDHAYSQLEKTTDPAERMKIADDLVTRYGDVSKSTTLYRQFTSAFQSDYGKTISSIAFNSKDILGEKAGTSISQLVNYFKNPENDTNKEKFFSRYQDSVKNDPEKLAEAIQMEQDFDELIESRKLYEDIESIQLGPLDSTNISKARAATSRFNDRATKLLTSRDAAAKEAKSKFDLAQRESNLKKTDAQTKAYNDREEIKRLQSFLRSAESDYRAALKLQEKEIEENDEASEETLEQVKQASNALETARNNFRDYDLSGITLPSDSSSTYEIPDTTMEEE